MSVRWCNTRDVSCTKLGFQPSSDQEHGDAGEAQGAEYRTRIGGWKRGPPGSGEEPVKIQVELLDDRSLAEPLQRGLQYLVGAEGERAHAWEAAIRAPQSPACCRICCGSKVVGWPSRTSCRPATQTWRTWSRPAA